MVHILRMAGWAGESLRDTNSEISLEDGWLRRYCTFGMAFSRAFVFLSDCMVVAY